jgi:hypothetical protein
MTRTPNDPARADSARKRDAAAEVYVAAITRLRIAISHVRDAELRAVAS